jgi:hypothetical protein
MKWLLALLLVAVPVSAQDAKSVYAEWLAETEAAARAAEAQAAPIQEGFTEGGLLQRGVGWGPGKSNLAGHQWVARFMDRPGAPVRLLPMPIGRPTPYEAGGDLDRDPPQTCPVRAAYVAWQGYSAGIRFCPGDRPGEAACGLETRFLFERSLARMCQLDRASLTPATGFDCVPTRQEVWFATATCARQAVCASNRLPGGLQASACSNPLTCATTEGCYTSSTVPAGTIGALIDTAYGCGTIPVCGTGAVAPPRCGDGKVDPGETCRTCPADAGACPPQPTPGGCDFDVSCQGGVISVTGKPRVTMPGPPCGSVKFQPGTASTGTLRVCVGVECVACKP